MEATVRIRDGIDDSLPALDRAGVAVVKVERADLFFHSDPPLDVCFFPGPALRGLLGRLLERLGRPEAMDFLLGRFKGQEVSWRLSFTEAPEPDGFQVRVSTFGPKAEMDLAVIVAAFSLPDADLQLPDWRARLSLDRTEDLDGCAITLGEAPDDGEPVQATECEIHFVTPLVIHRDGKRWRASDWAGDAAPLLDSARLRLVDLAGLRRKLAPTAVPARFVDARVSDVRLDLPLAGRHKQLYGTLGTARLGPLPAYSRGLLDSAELVGLGRSVSYGFGTVDVRWK